MGVNEKASSSANDSDPLNLANLRLSQDFAKEIGVKKVVTTIPVRKPDRQWFVRTRVGEEWRLSTAVLELKEERETYLVAPELWHELAGEIKPKVLFAAVNRQGTPFLWPINLPSNDGRTEHWSQSALGAAERATKIWVRLAANMTLGAYDLFEATGPLPDPQWPEDLDLQAWIRIAFKDRIIKSIDHPIVQRLQGLA